MNRGSNEIPVQPETITSLVMVTQFSLGLRSRSPIMANSLKKSIPSWQRSEAPAEQSQAITEKAATVEPSGATVDAPKDRSILLDEAQRFLDDDAVRNAAPEHKIAFLKSKGVQSREIQDLLEAEISKQQEVRVHSFRAFHHVHQLTTQRHMLKPYLLQTQPHPKLPPPQFPP